MIRKIMNFLFYGESIKTNITAQPQGINRIEIPQDYLTNFPINDLNIK